MSPAALQLFRQQAYLNGQWLDAPDGATQDIFNPATGELIGQVPNLGAAQAQQVIKAANGAWPAWRALTAKERSTVLKRWHALMIDNADALAEILTLEQGKPWPKPKAKSSTPPASSSGSPRKPSASTATPSRATRAMPASL